MATERKPLALLDLPLELLWMISENLPPADIACLALCNHYLLHCLAQTAFKNLSNRRSRTPSPTDDARIELLSRLSRTLPQYYLCFVCLRLHLGKNVELQSSEHPCYDPGLSWNTHLQRSLTVTSWPSNGHYKFYFVHLQLAMKRFYYGPEFGIPVESFLYTKVKYYKYSNDFVRIEPGGQTPKIWEREPHYGVLLDVSSFEARICSTPPGLCLRTQHIAVAKRGSVPHMGPYVFPMMIVCKHINSEDLKFQNILRSQLEGYCSTTSTEVLADEGNCDKCNSSWKFSIRTLDRTRAVLTFTVWMDLGPGLSVEDVGWKGRVDWDIDTPEHTLVDSRQRFERDSIQAGLPGALSEEEMFERNLALLRNKTFRKSMTWMGHGIYILHGEPKAKTRSSRCIIL